MSNFKTRYNFLTKEIAKNQIALEKSEQKLQEQKKIKMDMGNNLMEENMRLNNLLHHRSLIISKKDKLINAVSTLIKIMVSLSIGYAAYKFVTLPSSQILQLLTGILSFSIGVILCTATIFAINHITKKILDKRHKKIMKQNETCKMLSKEINAKRTQMVNKEKELMNVDTEIQSLLKVIEEQKEKIKVSSEELQELKNALVQFALENQLQLEETKPYVKVKKPDNI